MSSLQGYFLVASPRLGDENFYRSVVLMVHHDEQGALGVVLNRPTNHALNEIWEEIAGEICESTDPLYVGGPVSGTKLQDLPQSVRNTLKERVASAEVADIDKQNQNGQVVYKISFAEPGKNPALYITADGRIMQDTTFNK